MNKKEIDYMHELKMQELVFERETAFQVEELKWRLSFQEPQQIQAPQYYPPQQFQQQQYPFQGPEKQTEIDKSRRKYGGKQNE